jgi:glucose-6-phosphate-specific signal transduction histidine kinase
MTQLEQENAAQHAGASEAYVELSTTDASLVVRILDNGSGGANLDKRSGIRELADRIEAFGDGSSCEVPHGRGPSSGRTSAALRRLARPPHIRLIRQ